MGCCLNVTISRSEGIFDKELSISRAIDEISLEVSRLGSPLAASCSIVCSVAEIKWLPLFSSDGYALVDINGVTLLAK